MAAANLVVGDLHTGHRTAIELAVRIDGVSTANEQIVGDQNVGHGADVIVDHHRGGLGVVVDHGIVAHDGVGLTAIDLNPVVVRGAGGLEVVDIIALNDRATPRTDIDAVFDIVDIVAQEGADASDATGAFIVLSGAVDLTILDCDTGIAVLDLNR